MSVAFAGTGTQHSEVTPIVGMAAMSRAGLCVEMVMMNARPIVTRYGIQPDPGPVPEPMH
jgi:hypothetical protein